MRKKDQRFLQFALLLTSIFYLTACGQSGHLYLPEDTTSTHQKQNTSA